MRGHPIESEQAMVQHKLREFFLPMKQTQIKGKRMWPDMIRPPPL